jgi:signal transduction histidine kinase
VEGRYDRRVPAYREEELAAIGESVNRMVEKLQRLEEARLAGTARLAHELRTPLTILRSSLQGIRDGVVHPEEVPAFIEASLSETTRLQGLVGDLVDLSVLESSDMTLDIQETDVNALLASVVDETRPACQSGGHTLTLEADPGMIASVDPARIRQVLLNLLGNSIRHAGAGRNIQMQARIHGGMLTVSVRDDGPGIPAEVLRSYSSAMVGPVRRPEADWVWRFPVRLSKPTAVTSVSSPTAAPIRCLCSGCPPESSLFRFGQCTEG